MPRSDPPPSPPASSAEDALLLAVGHALPLPCVIALPTDGRILFANQALGTLLAVDAHYLVGDRLDRLFLEEAHGAQLRAQMLTERLPPQLPVNLRTHAGQPIAASLCAAGVALGADTLSVLFFLPLTETRAGRLPTALEALRQALPPQDESAPCLDQLQCALTRSP